LHEIVDSAGRDAENVCLLDDSEEGSFGSSARFEERREVVAIADPWDR